jgi:hypothetical protein
LIYYVKCDAISTQSEAANQGRTGRISSRLWIIPTIPSRTPIQQPLFRPACYSPQIGSVGHCLRLLKSRWYAWLFGTNFPISGYLAYLRMLSMAMHPILDPKASCPIQRQRWETTSWNNLKDFPCRWTVHNIIGRPIIGVG